jgi:hypothetical protein
MTTLESLKAAWEVRAGIIPGEVIPELTKKFYYTSRDREEDEAHAKELNYQPLFMKQMACATAYHQQMSDPRVNNWAELAFIWY